MTLQGVNYLIRLGTIPNASGLPVHIRGMLRSSLLAEERFLSGFLSAAC